VEVLRLPIIPVNKRRNTMAKLSQKQVQRLKDKWKLEDQARVIEQEIADLIAEPTARLKAVQAAIDEHEENVPDSYQDAWDDLNIEHENARRRGLHLPPLR
jgi:hypothetical protein